MPYYDFTGKTLHFKHGTATVDRCTDKDGNEVPLTTTPPMPFQVVQSGYIVMIPPATQAASAGGQSIKKQGRKRKNDQDDDIAQPAKRKRVMIAATAPAVPPPVAPPVAPLVSPPPAPLTASRPVRDSLLDFRRCMELRGHRFLNIPTFEPGVLEIMTPEQRLHSLLGSNARAVVDAKLLHRLIVIFDINILQRGALIEAFNEQYEGSSATAENVRDLAADIFDLGGGGGEQAHQSSPTSQVQSTPDSNIDPALR
jgi:hypothetical protein